MDWDDAYANGAYVPGAQDYPSRWAATAAQFREGLADRARCDVAYGARERERYDLFLPTAPPRGLAVYVHGGYWMRFGRSDWSHVTNGAVEAGWAALVPGYTLCPDVTIAQITRQVGAAITQAAGEVPGPLVLAGHSAGGHLVSRMICTNTPLDPDVLARIVRVLSISGVHDLRPLLRTAMNDTLRLTASEACSESPALLEPVDDVSLTCWVGGDERPEFIRQSRLLANIWTGLGARTNVVVEPGRNHFDVIDGLRSSPGAMVQQWLNGE